MRRAPTTPPKRRSMQIKYIIDDAATAAPWMGFGRSQAAKMAAAGVTRRHFPLGDVTVDVRVTGSDFAVVRISGGVSTFVIWPFLQLPSRRGGALLGSGLGYASDWLRINSAGTAKDMTGAEKVPPAPWYWAATGRPVSTPREGTEQTYLLFANDRKWPMARIPGTGPGGGGAAHVDISADGTKLVGLQLGGTFSSLSNMFTANITGDIDAGYSAVETGDLDRTILNAGFTASGRSDMVAAITAPGALWGTPFEATVTTDGVTYVLHAWDSSMDGEVGGCTFYTLWADARAGVAVVQVDITDIKVISPPDPSAINRAVIKTYLIAGGVATLITTTTNEFVLSNGSLTPHPIIVQGFPAAVNGREGSPVSTRVQAQFVADPTTKKYVGVTNLVTQAGTRFYGLGLQTALHDYWKTYGGAGVAADIESGNIADYQFYIGEPDVGLGNRKASLYFGA